MTCWPRWSSRRWCSSSLTVGELLFNGTGGGLTDRVLDLVSELATHAPALWTGTVLAAIIVGVRWNAR